MNANIVLCCVSMLHCLQLEVREPLLRKCHYFAFRRVQTVKSCHYEYCVVTPQC